MPTQRTSSIAHALAAGLPAPAVALPPAHAQSLSKLCVTGAAPSRARLCFHTDRTWRS
jgi:hypothetical protein